MDHKSLIPVVLCGFAFLLGSVPFGLFVARMFRAGDIRAQGSGNIGATNVSRVAGFWPAGAVTLALDMLKGALPVLFLAIDDGATIGSWFGEPQYAAPTTLVWLAGFVAILGHCFSPWLRFKGGKGVATGFGAIAVLSPWGALGGAIAFAVTFLTKRIGSLSSLTGLLFASIVHLVMNPAGPHLWVGAAIVFLIVLRHEANIDALLENRERTF